MRTSGVVIALAMTAMLSCEPPGASESGTTVTAPIGILTVVFHWDNTNPVVDYEEANTVTIGLLEAPDAGGSSIVWADHPRPEDDSPTVVEISDLEGIKYELQVRVSSGGFPDVVPGVVKAWVDFAPDEDLEVSVSATGPATAIEAAGNKNSLVEGHSDYVYAWVMNAAGEYLLVPPVDAFVWSSDDPSVAVAWNHAVHGVEPGNTTIHVSRDGLTTDLPYSVGYNSVPGGGTGIKGRWESPTSSCERVAWEIYPEFIKYYAWEETGITAEDWVLKETWSVENGDYIAMTKFDWAFAVRNGVAEHAFSIRTNGELNVDGGPGDCLKVK